jgi:molybdenum cofactor synthesis domain-containing protein
VRKVVIEDTVGMVVAHDMTRVIPGTFKGVGFKKGHVVKPQDIPELLKMGKKHLYVLDPSDGEIHEDEAAVRIAKAICGEHLAWSDPREGKIQIRCEINGLLKIDVEGLKNINMLSDISVATFKSGMPCKKGQTVAAARLIPLFTSQEKMEEIERLAMRSGPVIKVLPYQRKLIGLVVTGSEVYEGLIEDGSDAFVVKKFEEYGCELVRKIIVSDDAEQISHAIRTLKDAGCDLILTTGGLSVDPDDVTLKGVRSAGAEIVSYGTPVQPGSMFLNARIGDGPILGLPACVFCNQRTVYDIVLPRVLAGEEITAEDIAGMGHGGLCMGCDVCHFPNCSFGR